VTGAPPFPPTLPTQTSVTSLSPAIQSIVDRYDLVRKDIERALSISKRVRLEEEELYGNLKADEATVFLEFRERGYTNEECKAHVSIRLKERIIKYNKVKTTRAAISESLHSWSRELDVLAAALHAHNREMKG